MSREDYKEMDYSTSLEAQKKMSVEGFIKSLNEIGRAYLKTHPKSSFFHSNQEYARELIKLKYDTAITSDSNTKQITAKVYDDLLLKMKRGGTLYKAIDKVMEKFRSETLMKTKLQKYASIRL